VVFNQVVYTFIIMILIFKFISLAWRAESSWWLVYLEEIVDIRWLTGC